MAYAFAGASATQEHQQAAHHFASPDQANVQAAAQHVTLIRSAEVQARTGLSRSSMYARMNPGDPAYDRSFPLPVNVSSTGKVSNRWIASEVDAWIVSRPRTRAITAEVAQ